MRKIGIVLLVNDSITENRATALSIMALLLGGLIILNPLWELLFTQMGLKMAFLGAGACAAVSIPILCDAIDLHAKKVGR